MGSDNSHRILVPDSLDLEDEMKISDQLKRTREWPDPTPEMCGTPEFNAVWECIKTWDICVPEVDGDGMYSGATGNHVRSIIDALNMK